MYPMSNLKWPEPSTPRHGEMQRVFDLTVADRLRDS